MQPTLIFATGNRNKVAEIQHAIGDIIKVICLEEAGIHQDIPEPYDTLEENASIKSQTIFRLTGKSCFSEDTGLEVDALNGEPGVRSARYAGEDANHAANVKKLLENMEGKENRLARFRTVISLIWEGKEYKFEGICEGEIIHEPRGSKGFGYDPVFIPKGADKTFAQMNMEEKNRYSHRKKAALQLVTFLQQMKK